MKIRQAESESGKKKWRQYLPVTIGILLSGLVVAIAILLWDKVQAYGYLTSFLVSFLDGVTIIPLPAGLVVFTLAHKLNPLYLGLLAGLGDAIGGITVYFTGAWGRSLWSKFWPKRRSFSNQISLSPDKLIPFQTKLSSRWLTRYRRFLGWVERGGAWAVFIVAAFVWWLYYPVSLAAGTFHIGLKRFFLMSWAGKTIRGLIVAYAGYWGWRLLLRWIGG